MKPTAIGAKLPLAIGGFLIITGVVIPASALIGFLRTTPEALREHLLLGAALFKAGLVLQGLFMMISVWWIRGKLETPNEKNVTHRSSTAPSLLLGAILLTAFLLRLYKLDVGIWFDEIATYVSYMGLSLGEILTTFDNQNNHLLYTLFARWSFLIFGDSVWSLRFPAVLFGVGSIWAVYLFSCQVTTWKEGLLSAGFLTFSYHHVWFSQNARGYTGLLFWTMLSSWLLVRALREAKAGLWLMYGITTALGMMTHVTMAFVVFGHGAVFLAGLLHDAGKPDRRKTWLGGSFGFAVAGLVTFQLYSLVVPQLFNWQGVGVSPWQGKVAVIPWKSPIWMMEEIFKIVNIGPGGGILVLLGISVVGAGLVDFARRKSPVVILFIVPIVTGITVIMGVGSTLLPRLFFFSMGLGAIILVRGLMVCGERFSSVLRFDPARSSLVGIGLCAAVITVSAISVHRAYLPKQDYRGALEFVQETRLPGDVVVTVGIAGFPYQKFYKVDWQQVASLEDLNKVRSRGGRTWLVYTMPIVLQAAYPEIMKSINAEFQTVKEFSGTLNGGDIVVALAKS